MSKIFISYRRDDNPDAVKLINERLKKLLPSWEIFYDHHSLDLGDRFPDELRQAVTDAEFVLVVIGPKWLELLKERKVASETDYVHEEIRTAFSSESGVIPVAVGNANFPSEADLSGFPEIQSLANLNGKAIRPEPDFDKDIEALVGYLEARGPGVVVGSVLDSKYKLTREVGAGGMGIVYEAMQSKPDRRVAVKLIGAGKDTREVIARFDAERQALAMMDHENIAQVYDVGKSYSGRPYFVMEFVNGISITDYCNQERLSIRERLELFRKVCAAVQHAHQKGVLHRDIKPGNVLVTEVDGQATPKVIDFGLAKALGGKLSHHTFFTQIQTAVGTFGYSSPEQAAGKNVDTTTDIYSLGALLYEMLVGAPPFDVEELKSAGEDAMRRHVIDKDPVKPSTKFSSSGAATVDISKQRKIDPSKLQRILKGELDWVIMKALEKDRNRRYVTANDFASDIERYLNDEAVIARPPSTSYRVGKLVRKNRGLVASVAAIGFLLLAGIIGTSYGLMKANEKTKLTEKAVVSQMIAVEKQAIAEKEAKKESVRARDSEAASKFQLAKARWDANRVAEARSLLQEIPPKYRENFEWHFLDQYFRGSELTSYGNCERLSCVAFSPDGLLAATGSYDGTIRLWDTNHGIEIFTFQGHTGEVDYVAFTADGGGVLSKAHDETVRTWDIRSGEEIAKTKIGNGVVGISSDRTLLAYSKSNSELVLRSLQKDHELLRIQTGHSVRCIAFSPDTLRIATGGEDAEIKLWDARTGKKLHTLVGNLNAINCLSFSPDGSTLVSGGAGLRFYDIRSGDQKRLLLGDGKLVNSICFSPDGRWIVSGNSDNTISLRSALDGHRIAKLKGHTGLVSGVAFNPASAQIASASWDGTLRFWNAAFAFHQNARAVLRSAGVGRKTFENLTVSHDGQHLAWTSKSGLLQIWDANSGSEISSIKTAAKFLNCVAFAPHNSQIVCAGVGSKVKFWNSTSGDEIMTFEGTVQCVNFSRDGSHLVSAAADTITLWDIASRKKIKTIRGSAWINNVTFDPSGTRIAAASEDGSIRIWDCQSGRELDVLIGHRGSVHCLNFCENGNKIASVGDTNSIRIWDLATGKSIKLGGHRREVHPPNCGFRPPRNSVAINPDGSRVVSFNAMNSSIELWDADEGQEITSFDAGHDIGGVLFRSDGALMSFGGEDRTVKFWGVPNHKITSLVGHSDTVQSVSFSPDGKKIISGGYNGEVKLWDSISGNLIRSLDGHSIPVGVCFSPQGTHIYSDSFDGKNGTKIVWETSTGDSIKSDTWNGRIKKPVTKSPDGTKFVMGDGPSVLIVDLAKKSISPAINRDYPLYTYYDPRPKEEVGDWFGATFHYGWLVKSDPKNAELLDGLRVAHSKLQSQFKEEGRDLDVALPLVVREAIKLIHETKPANEVNGDDDE